MVPMNLAAPAPDTTGSLAARGMLTAPPALNRAFFFFA
jgi:hypothetical protein